MALVAVSTRWPSASSSRIANALHCATVTSAIALPDAVARPASGSVRSDRAAATTSGRRLVAGRASASAPASAPPATSARADPVTSKGRPSDWRRSSRNPKIAPGTTRVNASAAASAPATAAQPVARVVAAGELQFVDSIHNGMGPVQLVALGDQRFVRFDGVAITNAPDVHVYLAKETGGKWSDATSLYLGPLKATNGSFNYELPSGSAAADYRSVVVWCRQFRVLITWADLKAA